MGCMKCIRLVALFLFWGSGAAGQENDTTEHKLLPEVSVRAYEQNRRLQDVPAAISIINTQLLNRFGPASLVSALNSTPGVRMEERSPGSYRMNIRGSSLRSPFGVRNVKVYFNDIPFTQPAGTTYLNQLGFYNIQSMEIIKGPGSSLYGAGTGGVLLIESMDNAPVTGVQADYTYGSYHSHNAHAALTWAKDLQANRIGFQHQQSEGYRQQSSLRRDVFNWTGRYQLATGATLKTTFLYSDLFYGTPGALTATEFRMNPRSARPGVGAQPSAIQAKASIHQQTFVAGASLEQRISSILTNKTVLYGAATQLRNPNLRGYDQSNEPHVGGRTLFTLQPNLLVGTLQLQVGSEGQWGISNISNAKNVGGNADSLRYRDDVRNKQQVFFAQTIYAVQKWQFTAGGSLNRYKVSFQRFAPQTAGMQTRRFDNQLAGRLALLRTLGTVSVYTSLSQGFSPPTLNELLPTGGAINTALNPETGTNYDVGARGNLRKLRFDLNLFYFALQNTIVQRRDAQGGDFYLNSGKTSQKGLELSLQYPLIERAQVRSLIWTSFTHHAFRYKNFKPLNNDFSHNRLPGIAPNTLAAGTDLTVRNLAVHVTYQYTDVIPLNDANNALSNVNHLLGSQIQWHIPGMTKSGVQLFAGADNLLNQRYSLGYDINAFGGRYFNAAPERNYYAGMSLKFP